MEINYTSNTDEILAALEDAKVRALESCGLLAEGYAKRLCPVDTGNLRNSIAHSVDANGGRFFLMFNLIIQSTTRKFPLWIILFQNVQLDYTINGL